MAIPIPLFIIGNTLLLLLLSPPATAQQAPPDTNTYDGYGYNTKPSVSIIIITLAVILFLLGFFSMYIRHCSGTSATSEPTFRQAARSRTAPAGLDPSVIESFPTFDYSAIKSLHIGKGALECAVCLNEFEDDETLRLLPKCDHVFHPDCIDMWLVSHTTCPVCRADLTTPLPEGESARATDLGQAIIDVAGASETEAPALPPLPLPLNRSRTRRNTSGRPKWAAAMLGRSNSTGHAAFRAARLDVERFTLRLPEDIRSGIISGKLNRANSVAVALPREGSSRRGPRAGPFRTTWEGSSRGRMFHFFSTGGSVRSPKVAAEADAKAGGGDGGLSVSSCKAGDSVQASTVSDTNLRPV